MSRCLLVGCFASLLCSFANGENSSTPPAAVAEISTPRNKLSLPVLRYADGGDGYASDALTNALPEVEPNNRKQTEQRRDVRDTTLDELEALKEDLGKDDSDQSSTRDRWVGERGVTSIRNIRFVAPRTAEQSTAFRGPRMTSMHSTVRWVSPRAVHRTLFFNDNPLERQGKSYNRKLQPAISAVRFATDAVTFPINRAADLHRGDPLHYATSPR